MSLTTSSRRALFALSLSLILGACRLPQPATPTPITTPTPTVASAADNPCAFIEGIQDLPELSGQFLESLKKAGLPVESARAEAYGEKCVAADNSVVGFSARETDFHVTLIVNDLADEAILGASVEKILDIIDGVPANQTGPNPGYIGVTFKAGEQLQNLWFPKTQADELRAQGVQAADLYRALKNKP